MFFLISKILNLKDFITELQFAVMRNAFNQNIANGQCSI